MAMNNRGLGRGIHALFDGSGNAPDSGGGGPVAMLPTSVLVPNPAQPRKCFDDDALRELTESVLAHGVLQPLLARPHGEDGKYQLLAGERRLRAALRAGLAEVPVYVRELNDQEAMIATLLENLQREDLNPMEAARGLEALRNVMDATHDQLAETLGLARGTVSNLLRLLKLDPALQRDVEDGRISQSHAKALASLPQGYDATELRKRILEDGLNTKDTEEAVAFLNNNGYLPWQPMPGENAREETGSRPHPVRARRKADPDMLKLANSIGSSLNCRAKVSGNQDKGCISILYESNAQLFDLLEKLGLSLPSV